MQPIHYKTAFAPLDIDYQTNATDFVNNFGKHVLTIRSRVIKYVFYTLCSLVFIGFVYQKYFIDKDMDFLEGFRSKDSILEGYEMFIPFGIFTLTALICIYRLCSKIELYQYGAVFKTLFRKKAVRYDDINSIGYEIEKMTINSMRMYTYLLPESIRNTHIYIISTADKNRIILKSKHYFRLKTRMEHLQNNLVNNI